jgi:hypothetical protein
LPLRGTTALRASPRKQLAHEDHLKKVSPSRPASFTGQNGESDLHQKWNPLPRFRLKQSRSSQDSQWRNRSEFKNGRETIVGFLARKWQRELGDAR